MTTDQPSSKYQKLRAFLRRLTLTQWLLIAVAILLIMNYRQQSDVTDRLASLSDEVQSGHLNTDSKLDSLSSDVDDVKTELDSVESEMP